MDLWNKNKMLPIFKCDHTTSSTQILMLYIYYKNLYIHSCIYIFLYQYICIFWRLSHFLLLLICIIFNSHRILYFVTSFHFVQFDFIQFSLHSTFLRIFTAMSVIWTLHVVVIFEILWHIYWPSQLLKLHNGRAHANLQILRNILHHNGQHIVERCTCPHLLTYLCKYLVMWKTTITIFGFGKKCSDAN